MLALSLFLSSRSAPPTVLWMDLRTVSGDRLSSAGITLLPPPPGAEASAVPRAVAEQASLDKDRGTVVREIVLARLVDMGPVPPVDRLAWVVSTDARGLPGHGNGEWITDFYLSFIDARSGEWMFATSSGHMVGPQPGVLAATPTSSP